VAETPQDSGWDAQADWEAQVKAAQEALAQSAGDADTGPPAQTARSAPATPVPTGDAASATGTAQAPAATAVAEGGVPDPTVPLVPFTPFVAPLAPAVPVAGLDAGQAGLTVATATMPATAGMPGILGQDHLRTEVMPVRFLFPRLTVGQRERWWLWLAGAAAGAGALAAALAAWPLGLIVAGLILAAGGLFSYRISPAFSPAARSASARRRTRRRLARLGSAGYLSLHHRAIPGTGQVIDHLVVGPAGIDAVDSEVWDRRLPVRATRGGKLFHGPRDQEKRLAHARWEAGARAYRAGSGGGRRGGYRRDQRRAPAVSRSPATTIRATTAIQNRDFSAENTTPRSMKAAITATTNRSNFPIHPRYIVLPRTASPGGRNPWE
jgi:hypothetical protein